MEIGIILLVLVNIGSATPKVAPLSGNDFIGLSLVESVATLAAMMSKPDGIVQPMKGTPKDLISCIDPKHLIPMEHMCLDIAENLQTLPLVGNCSLADVAALPVEGNNEGLFNMSMAVKSIEETTSLSPAQVLAAAKSMGRCIESEFTLFQLLPESLGQLIQTNLTASASVTHRFGIKRKFEDRSNRLRIALCVFKGIIQNGCAEVETNDRSGSMRALAAMSDDVFSGDFLSDDDDSRETENYSNW